MANKDERYQVAGHSVHVAQRGRRDWSVWLNTEGQDEDDGLCIGVGLDRTEAVTHAVVTLKQIVDELERPVKS